jgi:hypothetical protein
MVPALIRPVLLVAVCFGTILFGGCAATEPEQDPNRVSTIPWNRPEGWEGAGALGGIAPTPGAPGY